MAFNMSTFIVLVIIYLGITLALAWYGYKKTKNASDYMVAGRKMNSLVLALSYGATFISTSAIIGFGGVAASYGVGLQWLAALNIIVGVIIAFLVFGPKMRKMGKQLHAGTFPEFIGKRFESRKLQSWVGLMITLAMPVYAAAVLIGSSRLIETTVGIPYTTSLLVFTVIVAVYVIIGGLISVIYTDAFQGGLMFIGMAILLVLTYAKFGGIIEAHTTLTLLNPELTSMPAFWSNRWWTMVSSLILGVGIGIIAQPQLAVRLMTAKDNKTLKRAVLAGGPFIFMMAGVVYIVGPLSNIYFFQETGQLAAAAVGGNLDLIIPTYINTMPEIFVMIFMLCMLAAAMSTAGSQFHTMGTAVGYDMVGDSTLSHEKKSARTIMFTRVGIVIAIIMALIWAYFLPESIIARATAFFMGLCTSALLPMYAGGLFWKKMTKAGAYASFGVGFFVSIFWYVFVHTAEATPIGICQLLFGQATLLSGTWMYVDPILIATPLSIIAAIVVSLKTQPPSQKLVEGLFSKSESEI
ncbi:MAG: sodium:solute symporter family protein [Methanimicrococcus sp.]|nr:sodium:solute symporter family protein [Methanimicrococcus sp.]